MEEWSEWLEFNTYILSQKVPNKKGVYKIKIDKNIMRFFGKSNILYIGQGKINNRLWCLAEPNKKWAHTAREKILMLRKKAPEIKLTFSYCISKNPKQLEKKLLNSYFRKHLELPPFNRIKGKL